MTRQVLIIVQNLPVSFERRMWLECLARIEQGLAWSHFERACLAFYERLTSTGA